MQQPGRRLSPYAMQNQLPRPTRSLNIVIMFLAGCAAAMLTASGQVLSTVGVYDEPAQTNGVDFVATGSTLSFGEFKSDVAAAFNRDFGGVNQCYAIGGDAGPYIFSYGVSQAKRLNMTGPANNRIGVTANTSSIQSISGTGIWGSLRPEMTFFLGDVSSSVANEAVIKFGLTIVSTTFFSLGDVTATATFSDGSKAIASRFINEMAGLGDTFFGFTAPSGQSLVSVTFTNSAGRPMYFDDIAFITAPFPSLTILKDGPSRVRVSWPTNVTGFSLEFTMSFPAQLWTPATNTPSILGDQFVVIFDSTIGQTFYRLRSQ